MRMVSPVLEWVSEKIEFFRSRDWHPYGFKFPTVLRETEFGEDGWTQVGLVLRSGKEGKALKITMNDGAHKSDVWLCSPYLDRLLSWISNNWPLKVDLNNIHTSEFLRMQHASLAQRVVARVQRIASFNKAPNFPTLVSHVAVDNGNVSLLDINIKTDGRVSVAVVSLGFHGDPNPPFALSPSDTEFFFNWMKENNPDL